MSLPRHIDVDLWLSFVFLGSETFSFVLTSFDGSRFYGYNRRLLVSKSTVASSPRSYPGEERVHWVLFIKSSFFLKCIIKTRNMLLLIPYLAGPAYWPWYPGLEVHLILPLFTPVNRLCSKFPFIYNPMQFIKNEGNIKFRYLDNFFFVCIWWMLM